MACKDKPNAPGYQGLTPIQLASKNGHGEIVKFLAGCTDSPNAPDPKGKTPMQYAVKNGHSEVVKALVPHIDIENANKTKFILDLTLIQEAAEKGYVEIVDTLASVLGMFSKFLVHNHFLSANLFTKFGIFPKKFEIYSLVLFCKI